MRDCSDSFVVIFSVFILSMPSKVIIIVIEFMFLGINMFWALLRAHFNPHLTAQAKNESESGPKHIYAREHKLYCFIIVTDIEFIQLFYISFLHVSPLIVNKIRPLVMSNFGEEQKCREKYTCLNKISMSEDM